MTNKIYIASTLKNYDRVLCLRDKLLEYGISLTYDWASEFKRHTEEMAATGIPVEEDFVDIAQKEYQAVVDCCLLLFVTPAGRGSHFELGVAYAKNKPIILLNDPPPFSDPADMIAFYTLPGIERLNTEKRAIERILEIVG